MNRRGESSRRGRGTGRGLAGGRNFERGESSCRGTGTGRGSGDAEDETPFTLLDASCAYHDRFGKRHFVMPKYYRDPCGFVEDPSDNQTGYGLADARLLNWSAHDMELSILKSDAKKNGTTPNAAAIKDDHALLSDPKLSDCSDSEIADLSED
ncbi:unnamed protein product [Camellia sinensis]